MTWDGPKWGREVLFPANPDLADILGDTDFDFEDFYFWDFLGPTFLAWAQLGPTHLGPPTRARLGPTHVGPAWAHPLGPGLGPPMCASCEVLAWSDLLPMCSHVWD